MKPFGVLALASGALAATCNPLKSSGCPADTALGTSIKEDFSSKSDYFPIVRSESEAFYGDDGLTLSIKKRFDNPSFKSSFYIMFGKVEVVMQAAEGQGIVSSFYLQSDDLDEIDIELLGGDDTQFQSNFFVKGNTATYDRGEFHTVSPNPLENFHTYTIDWSKDSLLWSLDGKTVRTVLPSNPQGYPQSPMYIMGGIWAGGDASNDPGTIEWAGGSTTYGPTYSMHIKSIIVTDYSTGDKYSYSDQSGTWESIDAENGKVNGRVEQADEDFEKLLLGGTISSGKDTSKSLDAASETASASESLASLEETESLTESLKESLTEKLSNTSLSKITLASDSLSSEAAESETTESDSNETSETSDSNDSATVYPKSVVAGSDSYTHSSAEPTRHLTMESSSRETSTNAASSSMSTQSGNGASGRQLGLFGVPLLLLPLLLV